MKIIFFDGQCPMCHSWVKRIIRLDKNKLFRFSPLENELAKKTLTPMLPDYLQEDTIIYYREDKAFLRSDAALKILLDLGFPFNLGIVFWIVPRVIRDGVYRWVASRRYTYGKRYDSCPMPPVEWRDRFV